MKTVSPQDVVHSMGPENKAVLEVEPGEEVKFGCMDCFSNKYQTDGCEYVEDSWEEINPATGPVAVKGAMPGDTLVVDILDMQIPDQGVMLAWPFDLALGPRMDENVIKLVPIEGDKAKLFGFDVPLNKMIGVIGVSPADESVHTDEPGAHGGNMDCKYVRPGVRMYFPVFVPGGNLSMGDMHAAMGDGEIFTGIEVPGEVTVRLDLIKGEKINWPWIETDDRLMVVCSHEDLDQAVETCINEMADRVMGQTGMSLIEAGLLIGLVGSTEICQVVDPKKTARMTVPKWLFEER